MSRRRTASDEDLLAAAARVINRVGPRLTLADVAAESGLSPATLMQRFGSKRGLLLAVARSCAGGTDECFAQVRAAHRSPLAAVFAGFEMTARCFESPDAMANSLAFLQMDLTDPDFHAISLEQSHAMTRGYRALLDEAVAAGELAPVNTARLARAIQAAASGSMLAWAVYREGAVADWVRKDLETLLDPVRIRRKRASGKQGRILV